jgi:hypothetical protein
MLTGNQLDFHINSPTLGPIFIGAAPFPGTNQWHHVAVTRSGTTYSFYIDGTLVGTVSNATVIPDVAAPLALGRSENLAAFDGRLDEVRIWNVAKTQAAIVADMGHGLTGTEAGLVASYARNEGSGITAFDLTANHHDAVLGAGIVVEQPRYTAQAHGSTVQVQGGVLSGSGTVGANVLNAAQVAPGQSLATLFVGGDYTQTADGTLAIEIGGLVAGSQFDQLRVSGNAALGGNLSVSRINGFQPDVGDSLKMLQFATVSGNFATTT